MQLTRIKDFVFEEDSFIFVYLLSIPFVDCIAEI